MAKGVISVKIRVETFQALKKAKLRDTESIDSVIRRALQLLELKQIEGDRGREERKVDKEHEEQTLKETYEEFKEMSTEEIDEVFPDEEEDTEVMENFSGDMT